MFKTVAIAGTFDRLHKGHRFFISEAFKLGSKVIIGLTSDKFADRKAVKRLKHLGGGTERRRSNSPDGGGIKIKVSNFQIREKELRSFLKQEGLLERAEITKIEDVYGPAISLEGAAHGRLEALVVTEETLGGGLAVNRKRVQLGFKSLKLLKIPIILAEDEKRIASTRIRYGEIDRWGKAFARQMQNLNDKFSRPSGIHDAAVTHSSQAASGQISNELRNELKKPLGILIEGNPNNLNDVVERLEKAVGKTNPPLISTVGDEVTKVCNEAGITINLAIVDYKVKREKKYNSLSELGFLNSEESVIRIINPPGHITKELVNAVKEAYLGIIADGKQRIIEVDGEEDLAGVPAILLAPLGSLVLYGQPAFSFDKLRIRRGKPQEGVVVVEVTEEKKQTLLQLLENY